MTKARAVVISAALLAVTMAASGADGRLSRRPNRVPGEYIVMLPADGQSDVEALAQELARKYDGHIRHTWKHVRGFLIRMSDENAVRLSADPRVRFVEENGWIELAGGSQNTNVDPSCVGCSLAIAETPDNRQWHLDRIDQDLPPLDRKYNYCTAGAGVRIYVVDTGVMRDHLEFGDTPEERRGRVLEGFDATYEIGANGVERGEQRATNPCGGFPRAQYAGSSASPEYTPEYRFAMEGGVSHGTAVASLAAGKYSGVAKEAYIVPVKVNQCDGLSNLAFHTPRNPRHPYRQGDRVTMCNALRYIATTTGTSADGALVCTNENVIVDGDVEWRRHQAGELAPTDYAIRGINFIIEDLYRLKNLIGTRPPAVATFSFSTESSDALVAALNQLANEDVAIFASANNAAIDACATVPPQLSRPQSAKKVITVGGTMLVNDPDFAHFRGVGEGDGVSSGRGASPRQPVYDGTLPTIDARWICGPGDSVGCVTGTLGSNFGECVTLWAPAKNINSAGMTSAYSYRDRLGRTNDGPGVLNPMASGTSFAAPLAAGVAARFLSTRPRAGREAVYDALVNTGIRDIISPFDLNPGFPQLQNNIFLRASDVMFVKQPGMVTVQKGQSATLTVDVAAPPGVTYKWYRGADRGNIALSTEVKTCQDIVVGCDSLTINAAQETTFYWVRVGGACPSTPGSDFQNDSAVGVVIVRPPCTNPPAIFAPPAPTQYVEGGAAATLGVSANGTAYQWFEGESGDTRKPAGAGTTLSVTPAETTRFWVRVLSGDSSCYVDSDAATVSFREPPSIDKHPFVLNSADTPGLSKGQLTPVPLVVRAEGTNLQYQWYRGQTGDESRPVEGCVSSACHTPAAILGSGPYWVRVWNEWPCPGQPNGPCVLKSQTVSFSVCATANPTIEKTYGDPIRLSVPEVTGATYQWYQGASPDISRAISGATSREYSVPRVPQARGTSYWIRVTANSCEIDSLPAKVDTRNCRQLLDNDQPRVFGIPTSARTTLIVESRDPASHFAWYRGASGVETDRVIGALDAPHLPVQTPTDGNLVQYWARVSSPDLSCTFDTLARQVLPMRRRACCIFPSNPVIYAGASVTLRVPETGEGYVYEWYSGDNYLVTTPPLGTEEELTVTPAVTTSYWVRTRVPSEPDPIDSLLAVVTVIPVGAIRVTIEPPDGIIDAGSPAVLIASHSQSLSYQWYQGSTYAASFPIAGAVSSTLEVRPLVDTDYWVRGTASNGVSYDSAIIRIRIRCAFPYVSIGSNPSNGVISKNETAQLSAFGAGKSPKYIWYRGEPGQTSSIFNQGVSVFVNPGPPVQRIWVRLIDGCGQYADSNAVTVYTCLPVITVQPSDQVIRGAETRTLRVIAEASNAEPLRYQWYRGVPPDISSPVVGETLHEFNVDRSDVGSYWVAVYGKCDASLTAQVNSNPVTVTACDYPVITSIPALVEAQRNTDAPLAVSATGTALSYQWYRGEPGDTSLPVAYGDAATVSVFAAVDSTYWVRVSSNINCSVDSQRVQVVVCDKPTISQQPVAASAEVMPGTATTLSVAANGVSLTYQWYRGFPSDRTNPIAGANSPSFTTPALTQDTTYWVEIRSGFCKVSSYPITVRVCAGYSVHFTSAPQPLHTEEPFTLSVNETAPAGSTIRFYWYRGPAGDIANSTLLEGPTTAKSKLVSPTQTSSYWVRAKKLETACFSDSPSITLQVCLPTITQQPVGAAINNGQSAPLSVVANGGPLTYQWYAGESGVTTAPQVGKTTASATFTPSVTTRYWVRVTGSCSAAVDSQAVTVAVCIPAAISAQPAPSVSIQRGQVATLSLTPSDSTATVTWYVGNPSSTATPAGSGASIPVQPTDTTTYWARVSSGCGTADSTASVVHVCLPPTISVQPQNAEIFAGTPTTLSVTASASTSEPLRYQWYQRNADNSNTPVGTSSPSYTTPVLSAPASFWVKVSSDICVTSSQIAVVTMCTYAQSVAAAPNHNIAAGGSARLQSPVMSATGTSFRWYVGASGVTSHPIGPWQVANYVDVWPASTTDYWYQVQKGACTSSSGTSRVSLCIPTITQQPASVTIVNGSSTMLAVQSSLPTSTYQWYRGSAGDVSSPLSGGTAANQLVTPTVSTNYWVRVGGTCGQSVDSATATVTVCEQPVITAHPQHTAPWPSGSTNSLSVSATGTNLTYQWYRGASGETAQPVSGAVESTYTASPSTTDLYWVRVSGMCGSVNSTAAYMNVLPVINQQPSNINVTTGTAARLTLTASGSYMSYTWRNSSGIVSGPAASPVYIIPSVTAANTTYMCNVTSGTGTINSQGVSVKVCSTPRITSVTAVTTSPGCKAFNIALTGSPTAYTWYKGVRGDAIPANVVANTRTFNTCTAGEYWARTTGNDPNLGVCYSDSALQSVP